MPRFERERVDRSPSAGEDSHGRFRRERRSSSRSRSRDRKRSRSRERQQRSRSTSRSRGRERRSRSRSRGRGRRDDGRGHKRGRDDHFGSPRHVDDYRGGAGYKHRRRGSYEFGGRGPPPRYRSPPRQQPVQPAPTSVAQMLTELLVEIGNPRDGSIEQQLDQLAAVLKKDLADNQSLVSQLMLDCVVELPAQAPVYGTLCGLLNEAASSFGAAIVQGCHEHLQREMNGENALHVRLLLRFMGELVNANVIHPGSMLELLNSFVESAIQDSDGDGPKQQADFLVAVVLETLIWVGRTLAECRSREVTQLLGQIDKCVCMPERALCPSQSTITVSITCLLNEQIHERPSTC